MQNPARKVQLRTVYAAGKLTVHRLLLWRNQKIREACPTTALIVNRDGRPFSKEAAKSAWRRAMERPGQEGEFTFHDIRALRADTLPEDVAVNVLAHESPAMVRKVYGNRRPKIIDLKGNK